ncbi:MAG TPA: lysylphosphatidylglycerol synthase transmembrane domain-containing protein [Rhodothermales bacterium]|nr:lysylphosphatidylglycerol synthase transmembrane domain-containing protein [Rhodothermales bacterium]
MSTSSEQDTLLDAAGDPAEPVFEAELSDKTSRLSFGNMVWPVLLSLAVLVGIGYFTYDPTVFRQLLRELNGWLLAAALATVGARIFFGGWRLNHFSAGRLNMKDSLRSQVAWDFFAYVTPSTIGGGPFVAFFIAKDRKLPLGETTSLILFSMLMDQISLGLTMPLLMLCSIYLDVFPQTMGTVGYWIMTGFFVGYMTWILFFAYSTLFRPHLLAGLVERILGLKWLQRFRERAMHVMSDMQQGARMLRTQRASFYVKGAVLTVLPWISRYLLSLFIIWSVYPGVDKVLVFLRSVAMNLGSLAMPTPGGAGGVEGLYVLFLGPPLIPEALVAPTLLVWRLLSYYLFVALGLFVTMHYLQQTLARKKQSKARM